MSIGDVTDEALFTLVQTTMAELERLEDIEEQLDKEKEKNKALHNFIMFTGGKDIKDFSATEYMRIRQEGYIDGRCYEQQKAEEIIMKNYISKDKIKAIQGQLIMQLGSYVRNEASPEQERIAGGINITNKILEENRYGFKHNTI